MIEVQDVFNEYGEKYRKEHKLPLHHLKVMRAIETCRTFRLGGHVEQCDECGHMSMSYNSCRNRHCPKCQASDREKWIEERKKDLLPVSYFHIVFTIPNELNELALRNQSEVYNILFRAASKTLLELGKDPKHIGGLLGFIAILHTWGQNLMDHPHLHCIVPGGGLSQDEQRWMSTKKEDFFIHVNVLSELFKGKFMDDLKKAYRKRKLKFVGTIENLRNEKEFEEYLDELYEKSWVVYAKPPFGGAEQVLEYIGRYTHRVAISNRRILKMEDGKVAFRWRDYKEDNKNKVMTVSAEEFIRRFLLHILPDNFMKIRYYGFLSNRNIKTKLKICKKLLMDKEPSKKKSANKIDLLEEIVKETATICPCCSKGRMRATGVMLPMIGGPPETIRVA